MASSIAFGAYLVMMRAGRDQTAVRGSQRPATGPEKRITARTSPAADLVAFLLSVDPIRRAVMAVGRWKVIYDARKNGLVWEEDVTRLRDLIPGSLEPLRSRLVDPMLVLPEYYKAPFHAYPNGNLGWLPALEAEVSSLAVHAKHSREDPGKGDMLLRGNAVDILSSRWDARNGDAPEAEPREILDIGCSVGLSSAGLARRYPAARVVGVDPSVEMLAVGALRRPNIEFRHGLGESLPKDFAKVFDLVNIHLVAHELPEAPFLQILSESMRALRPGGMICVMDVASDAVKSVPPLVGTLFKSTEPYIQDHQKRDIAEALQSAGFIDVACKPNTATHLTYTGFKNY